VLLFNHKLKKGVALMNYDRIILELIDRVSLLEDEVQRLKSIEDSSKRDTTKYIFDGEKHGKGRLALAIVKKYMEENPQTSANELMTVFDKSLQGSYGVIQKIEDAKKNRTDYKKRFFALPNEVIKTSTETCVVCSQWGIDNIGNMIARARQLGFEITAAVKQ
jgi:hypothetical protein